MSNPGGFRDLQICSVFVRVAVMMYVCGLLSRRNIERLVHERGISITHEKTRFCWTRFGAIFAFEIGRLVVQTIRRVRHRRWHLDKVSVKINGVKLNLWRAGDQEGEVHGALSRGAATRMRALDSLNMAGAGDFHRLF